MPFVENFRTDNSKVPVLDMKQNETSLRKIPDSSFQAQHRDLLLDEFLQIGEILRLAAAV